MDLQKYIQIGRVGKSHGLKGEVKVTLYPGMPDVFCDGQEIVLQKSDNDRRIYILQSYRWQGKNFIVKFEGVTSRDDSELLTGNEIWLSESCIPALAPDQYYLFEYEGMNVVTDKGLELGVVQNVFATGANDVLVVTGQGKDYLIPVIEDVLVEVDKSAGRIVISPLPGLLDMNG